MWKKICQIQDNSKKQENTALSLKHSIHFIKRKTFLDTGNTTNPISSYFQHVAKKRTQFFLLTLPGSNRWIFKGISNGWKCNLFVQKYRGVFHCMYRAHINLDESRIRPELVISDWCSRILANKFLLRWRYMYKSSVI